MNRLKAVGTEEASGKTKEMFEGIQAKLGMVPNMMRTMGNSSVVLEGYLGFSGALAGGSLGAKMGELIAMTVSQANACDYCLSAHSLIGEKMAGLEKETLTNARQAIHTDPKIEAGLEFAQLLVKKQGMVSEEDVFGVLNAGYTQGEVAEIIAHVALNIFTNYFNNTAKTTIDFPEVNASEIVAMV